MPLPPPPIRCTHVAVHSVAWARADPRQPPSPTGALHTPLCPLPPTPPPPLLQFMFDGQRVMQPVHRLLAAAQGTAAPRVGLLVLESLGSDGKPPMPGWLKGCVQTNCGFIFALTDTDGARLYLCLADALDDEKMAVVKVRRVGRQ